jgi:hypothetical protein
MLSTAHDAPSIHSDILVPLDIDKNRILYNDNPASAKGMINEVHLYFRRVGLFETFIAHRACNLGIKIIIEDRSVIPFILGVCYCETYDLTNTCPDVTARVSASTDAHALDSNNIE